MKYEPEPREQCTVHTDWCHSQIQREDDISVHTTVFRSAATKPYFAVHKRFRITTSNTVSLSA